jgi:hypothetical protein
MYVAKVFPRSCPQAKILFELHFGLFIGQNLYS